MIKNIVLLLSLFFVLSVSAQNSQETPYGVLIPKGFTYQLDVPFTNVNGWEGNMDLYLPPVNEKRTPIVINIFGGGWNHGNKEMQRGFSAFFKAGCAVANIEYRLVDVAPAPAAIEDVRSALLYIIKNATELNIDVNKIVVMGGSAGGHLAMMCAYLGDDHRFDLDYEEIQQVKVAAVLNKYGIADMTDFSIGAKPYQSAVRWIGEMINQEAFIASVSPISYVHSKTPPTFIVHGDADPIVPYQQSVQLHNALMKAKVQSEFMTVKDGLHGKFTKEKNSEITKAMIDFLKAISVIE